MCDDIRFGTAAGYFRLSDGKSKAAADGLRAETCRPSCRPQSATSGKAEGLGKGERPRIVQLWESPGKAGGIPNDYYG